jgi:hypothetical protein
MSNDTGSSFKTKKICFISPISLWIEIRESKHFYKDFDEWACQIIYEKLVAEGHIKVEKAPVKKPRKKAVAGDEAR